MAKVKKRIPKICGKCQHYIFIDRQDGKDKLIDECAEGIEIVNNKSLKTGCPLFRKCAKCSRCGILIGPHHLNTNPILLNNKTICGMCYEDQKNKDNHKHKLNHAERGKLGGLATARKYSHDHLVDWGRKGGKISQAKLKRQYPRHRSNGKNKEGARGDLIASGSGRSND